MPGLRFQKKFCSSLMYFMIYVLMLDCLIRIIKGKVVKCAVCGGHPGSGTYWLYVTLRPRVCTTTTDMDYYLSNRIC